MNIGLLGWLCFWIFVAQHWLGQLFVLSVSASMMVVTVVCLKRNHFGVRDIVRSHDFYFPLIVCVGLSALYLTIIFLKPMNFPVIAEFIQNRFFDWSLPNDNILPYVFADKLYRGVPVSPLAGNWLSSDRPPLQVGIILWQFIFAQWAGWAEMGCQVVETLSQSAFVCAIWVLTRTFKFSKNNIYYILFFISLTGFAFLHSVFAWPKLLAGSYVIFAIALWLDRRLDPRLERPNPAKGNLAAASLMGIAVALGLLSHGGVIFTVVPLAFFILIVRAYRLRLGELVIAGFSAIITYFPWIIYQRLIDPPGDRLIKMHLAGIMDVQPGSALLAIKDAYASRPLAWIWDQKLANFKFTIGPFVYNESYWTAFFYHRYDELRRYEFFHPLVGLAIAAVGIVPLINKLKSKDWRDGHQQLIICGTLAIVSLLFWNLILFGGMTTSIHQGSYATTLLLYICLVTAIAETGKRSRITFAVVNFVWFLAVWVKNIP